MSSHEVCAASFKFCIKCLLVSVWMATDWVPSQCRVPCRGVRNSSEWNEFSICSHRAGKQSTQKESHQEARVHFMREKVQRELEPAWAGVGVLRLVSGNLSWLLPGGHSCLWGLFRRDSLLMRQAVLGWGRSRSLGGGLKDCCGGRQMSPGPEGVFLQWPVLASQNGVFWLLYPTKGLRSLMGVRTWQTLSGKSRRRDFKVIPPKSRDPEPALRFTP